LDQSADPVEIEGGHEGQWLQLAVQTAILAMIVNAAGPAHGGRAAGSSSALSGQEPLLQNLLGVSGKGYRGAFPMPRLAVQQP
jgi:hypothetical protein